MSEKTNAYNEFEQALSESLSAGEVRPGAVVEGVIAGIHGDVVLVDIGGKSEAYLDREELDELGTGDPVEVVVVSGGDEVKVSRRLALERKLKEQLGGCRRERGSCRGQGGRSAQGRFRRYHCRSEGFLPRIAHRRAPLRRS